MKKKPNYFTHVSDAAKLLIPLVEALDRTRSWAERGMPRMDSPSHEGPKEDVELYHVLSSLHDGHPAAKRLFDMIADCAKALQELDRAFTSLRETQVDLFHRVAPVDATRYYLYAAALADELGEDETLDLPGMLSGLEEEIPTEVEVVEALRVKREESHSYLGAPVTDGGIREYPPPERVAPEDVDWDALTPQQQEWLSKYLPETAARTSRSPNSPSEEEGDPTQ